MRERLFITGRNSEPQQIGPDWETHWKPSPPTFFTPSIALHWTYTISHIGKFGVSKNLYQMLLCSDFGHFTFWQHLLLPIKSAGNCSQVVKTCAHLVKLVHNNLVQFVLKFKYKLCTFWKILPLPPNKSTASMMQRNAVRPFSPRCPRWWSS